MIVWAQAGSGSRRALELSHRMGCDLHYLWPQRHLPMPLRVLWCGWRSLALARGRRPSLLVIQVGPAIEASVGMVAKWAWGIPYVLDCHAGVFVDPRERRLYRLTGPAFRRARAVVVHDPSNAALAKRLGVDAVVLADPIPAFPDRALAASSPVKHPSVLVPASWRRDEPISSLLGAAQGCPG